MSNKKSILDMLHEYNSTLQNMMEAFDKCQKGISELIQEVTSMPDDDTPKEKKYAGSYYMCSSGKNKEDEAVLFTFIDEPFLGVHNGRPYLDVSCRKVFYRFGFNEFGRAYGDVSIDTEGLKVYGFTSVEEWLNQKGYSKITEKEYVKLVNKALSRFSIFAHADEY